MTYTPQNCQNMTEIRKGIDQIDRELMNLLKLRSDYIDRAAEIKLSIDMPARIDDRVEEFAQNARQNAISKDFDPDLAEKIWRLMIEWSIEREEDKLRKKS